MSDRPIIFSGPMIRALIDGQKTQTRRVLKPQPDESGWQGARQLADGSWQVGPAGRFNVWATVPVPYAPGDRLWVREAHRLTDDGMNSRVVYEADQADIRAHTEDIRRLQEQHGLSDKWAAPHLRKRPSVRMPRWASRLTLTVTEVRVQRLQEITGDDMEAEGVTEVWEQVGVTSTPSGWPAEVEDFRFRVPGVDDDEPGHETEEEAFRSLWDGLNDARGYGWDANPWVIALTFTVHHQNIDQMEIAA